MPAPDRTKQATRGSARNAGQQRIGHQRTQSRNSEITVTDIASTTLGRRIAAVFAAAGSDVRIFDLSAEQRDAARDYVESHIEQTQQVVNIHPAVTGHVETAGDLEEAVANAWMVVEAVPEKVDLKQPSSATWTASPSQTSSWPRTRRRYPAAK